MKTTPLPLILTAFALLSFSSCKKDKDETPPDPLAQKIQWKWRLANITVSEDLSGSERTVMYDGLPTDYMEFRSDGKMYTDFKGKRDTSDYSIIPAENKITIDGDNATILELTDNSLVLHDKDYIATLGSTRITYYLKK